MGNASNQYNDCFYIAVKMNTGIDYRCFADLMEHKALRTYRDIADKEILERISKEEMGLRQNTVGKVRKLLDSFGEVGRKAKEYSKLAEQNGLRVVSCLDVDYPYNWRVLGGMPNVFFAKGRYSLIDQMTLHGAAAVVGSRNPSKYSQYATDRMCRELGEKGIAIVSGMAYGIDRQAHLSSVDTKGGTIAILAGGADNIYPPANKDIYDLISAKGLIISEMPPGQTPLRQYFPSRNRLIAGLSDCTLVMEAGAVSGTLHTASYSAAQGKEVFVLPNSIYYENAMGGLKLLEDGGNILLGTDNVIDSISRAIIYKRMGLACPGEIRFHDDCNGEVRSSDIAVLRELAKVRPEELTDDNWKSLLLDALTLKPLCADELCKATMLPFYKVSGLLTELELKGSVCQEKGKYSLTFV